MTQNLLQALATITKNTGLALVDNLSMGAASAFKDSITEIQEYTKITNDALYYMQIQTFLETADLNQEEVNEFLEENQDNQRLGLEVFKILEKTYLEKQAQLIAIAFRRYVKKEIEKKDFDRYIHIIDQLTQHSIKFIEVDTEKFLQDILILDKTHVYYSAQLKNTFIYGQRDRIPELITLGFMEEVVKNRQISQHELDRMINGRQEFEMKQDKYFKRTEQYYEFVCKIYIRTLCTE